MKNKKGFIIFVVIFILTAMVTTISVIIHDYGKTKYDSELYFFNETSTSLVMENRTISYRTQNELIENVIGELMKGPDNNKHSGIIEKKTRLLSLDGVETGKILVNFSEEFLIGDNTKDVLAIYAVVKSLSSLQDVVSVKVIVDGKDISTADGAILGFLNGQDINLLSDTYNSETREVMLYFPAKDGSRLVSEQRAIKVTDQQPLAQYIINELIKGPQGEELARPLSKDTVLLSVETSGDVCFVNFKGNFVDKNSSTAEKEKMTVYAIVDSLTELESINRVHFLIDGKRVDSFGNINIGSMFGRDESLIG